MFYSHTFFRYLSDKIIQLILLKPAKSVEVALPVCRMDRGILDGIAAVDHHAVPAVYPHMADRPCGVVCAGKKDDIPRLCIRCRYPAALVINPLCSCPGQVVDAAV